MKIIRFLIPLLLIIAVISPSCKKGDTDNTGPVDSSKLLPAVISYYVGVDSLLISNYYYYDNQNRIIRQASITSGVTTDSRSYSYDSNGNLTNIMVLSPHYTSYGTIYGSTTGTDTILHRWQNAGPVTYPITIAPITSYDTLNYAIRYTNGLPDSAIVTGGQNKQSIKYTLQDNKVSAIRIITQTFGASIYGNPTNSPVHYSQDMVNFTYSGDDITQITDNNAWGNIYTFSYNIHKSAFCNINMKWILPTGLGDNGFYKHDLAQATRPISLPSYNGFTYVPLEQDYTSIYNKYDYPVQTNMPYIGNENLQVYNTIKFMKYTYIVAK